MEGGYPFPPQAREYSEETAREIDCSVHDLVQHAFERALELLTQSRKYLEEGAKELLQKETLTEQDIKSLQKSLAGETQNDTTLEQPATSNQPRAKSH